MSRILTIDDDADFSRCLQEILEGHGHRVECAISALAGLERLAADGYDLVLLDNMMPDMTGLKALEELQQRKIDVPVIMMTNQGTSETTIKATMLGAFNYVE